MKKIFTLLLLLFPFFRAHAQPDSILKAQHDRLLSQLFAAQSYTRQPGAKTTGPAERLVAMNIYRDTNATGTWIRTDSARLTYSSTRGSVFNMQNMHFGSFSYLNTFWPGPTDFLIIISSLPYDSLYTYQYTHGSITENIYRKKYNSGNITDSWSSKVGDTTRLHSWYRYDLAGRLYWTRNFVVTPHPNLYEWTGDYYFYNAKGKILEDSSVTSVFADTNSITNPTEKWEYTYNTAGTLTDVFNSDFSGAWFLITHYIIAYAAANQIKSVYQYNAGPYLYQIDSFSYTPGIPYYTFHSDSSFDASASVTSFQESDQKFVNASGLVDSMIYLQPNYKVVHYYNYTALGNPFSDSITIFNADTLTSETMVHYYYEPIPTAVQSVSNPTSDIQVYPNPAAAELYFHSETKIASVRLSLYNAQGQQVVCTALPMSSGYAQFNIAHLTQGIYFLTLTDENGGSIKKQTIVKL